MAAAGGALLRSANKMAPRIASALDRRGRLPATSRLFSTSSASTPPPPNLRGSQPGNKKIFSDNERELMKTAAIEAATACAFFTVVGGIFVICGCVKRALV